jgi:hypothetical protein
VGRWPRTTASGCGGPEEWAPWAIKPTPSPAKARDAMVGTRFLRTPRRVPNISEPFGTHQWSGGFRGRRDKRDYECGCGLHGGPFCQGSTMSIPPGGPVGRVGARVPESEIPLSVQSNSQHYATYSANHSTGLQCVKHCVHRAAKAHGMVVIPTPFSFSARGSEGRLDQRTAEGGRSESHGLRRAVSEHCCAEKLTWPGYQMRLISSRGPVRGRMTVALACHPRER